MANRKAAEAYIIKWIDRLLPGSSNAQMYRDRFAEMSDAQFDEFMKGLKAGDIKLAIIAPNLNEPKLETKRNLDIAKEIGYEFFEQIWMHPEDGSPAYLTPKKYLVYDLPLRRQAQHLVKKISIPEDNKSVDDLTGQPTGKSKGSKISYPEIQVLAALDLPHSITEWIKYRGGDRKGFNALNDSISKTGSASQEAIAPLAGGVESTKTLHTLLTCMHLSNTL
jgi:hypothetical protein